ncbi:hypothetical protein AB0C13_25120 [Streptomyces sp. NPDC049099]|uniref:hypothetical protein n=1 Tax=Streptomyces sp. NPDC049099 TaxID=3155768 RepID=UPI0034230FAA
MKTTSFSFGMGSMVPKADDAESARDWRSSIEDAFNSIPSVRDLVFTAVFGETTLHRDGDVFVVPAVGEMSFRVTIPSRIQEKLSLFPVPPTAIEEFDVTIVFGSFAPVTSVVCVGAEEDHFSPSTAVVVVREFLEAELGKLNGSNVTLSTVGPSPFHVDFHVRPGVGEVEWRLGLSCTFKAGIGYRDCVFYYDPEVFSSVEEVMGGVLAHVRKELSGFYYLQIQRNHRMNVALDLNEEAEALTYRLSEPGVRAFLRRTRGFRRALNSLKIAILKSRLMIARHHREAQEIIGITYLRLEVELFRPYLDEVVAEKYEEELDAAEKIVDLLDERQTHEAQRFVSFTVALIGVIVGSVLTAILRKL